MPATTKKNRKKTAGRPALPDKHRRDKRIDTVRFSAAELESLRERAAASGLSWTDWVRGRLGL